jgi:hypothetical protein
LIFLHETVNKSADEKEEELDQNGRSNDFTTKLHPRIEARLEEMMNASRQQTKKGALLSFSLPTTKRNFKLVKESERPFDLADCFLVIGLDPEDLKARARDLEARKEQIGYFSPKLLQKVSLSEYGQNMDRYPSPKSAKSLLKRQRYSGPDFQFCFPCKLPCRKGLFGPRLVCHKRDCHDPHIRK